jgi:hypothetical protein
VPRITTFCICIYVFGCRLIIIIIIIIIITLSPLCKIVRIYWPDQITNKELWKRSKQLRIDLQIRKRKWGRLGHTLRKPPNVIARQALEWDPQGKRAGQDRGVHGKERCLKRPKELITFGRRSKLMPRTELDGGFLWKPYVPQRNDGILYIYLLYAGYSHLYT